MTDETGRFQETTLFKKLLRDAPNMEEDLRIFNMKYRRFIERDDAVIGAILRCHLVVEHFLDEYLSAANPAIEQWDSARLTFAQKVALADNRRGAIRILIPGLRCLNSLRNRLAHRLNTEFDHLSIDPISEFMTVWYTALKKPIPEGVRLIEEFALQAGGWLHGSACMILRHAPSHGLHGLLDWYADSDDK